LSGTGLRHNDLTGWNFAGQNLTSASFGESTLRNADLTDAVVVGASFEDTTSRGFTKEQMYATASYKSHDLSGIGLGGNDLTGWNFADAIIAGASFHGTGFTKEQLYSTASYRNHDLTGIGLEINDLTGWNLAGQNLTSASFSGATLTNADLTDAVVMGASFSVTTSSGFTKEQLYSTASYKNHDLSGIGLVGNDLTGWNFAGQNLTNAHFYPPFFGPDWYSSTLTDTDLRGADTRGAYLEWSTAIVGNTLLPNGHVQGLDLGAGQLLVVRDHDGNPDPWIGGPPISIVLENHFLMGPGGVLQMLFEADAWDSTISFEADIPVTIAGGTLELRLAAGVVPTRQIGRTFDLFDWTGVESIGEFSIVSPYAWDSSRLYSAGEITFAGVPEASSLALLALGFSSLLLTQHRVAPRRPLGGRFARPRLCSISNSPPTRFGKRR
jgi:uncharacterized protein YjbI with pentapeptide repeats